MHSYRNKKRIETVDAPNVILDLYNKLNSRFFDNELPGIQVFLTPNIKEIVHFENNTKIVFNRVSEEVGHLNVSATALGLSPHELCAALLHEMCHRYCSLHEIKDISRGGFYHNKKFRDVAMAHGLLVIKDKTQTNGWSETFASPDLIQWCRINLPEKPIDMLYYKIYKQNISQVKKPSKTGNPNSHSIKYVCPRCGQIARTTKISSLVCGYCYVPLTIEGMVVSA